MLEEKIAYRLWCVLIMGISNQNTVPMMKKYPDAEELYHAMREPNCQYLTTVQKKRALSYSMEDVQKILNYCEQHQIELMSWYSEYYPEQLREIYNPPALFFYRGNPAFLKNETLMTVVGTRHPSEYSRYAASRLCQELAEENFTLISGFALGLDTIAHEAAIQKGKPTIAVLGCGIDQNYPKGSRELKEKVSENGLLLTEYPPGTPPKGVHFPVRNRILAGLAEAVLVTEAKTASGCLITADYACEQGKDVFCIPPSDIYDQRYSGQVKLLREGAFPIFGAEDVINTLNRERFRPPQKESLSPETPIPKQEENPPEEPKTAVISELSDSPLSEKEQRIIKALFQSQKNINMLCCETEMGFSEIVKYLFELEMLGWIQSCPADFYKLTPQAEEKYTA